MQSNEDQVLSVAGGTNSAFFTTIDHNKITTAVGTIGSGKTMSENAAFKIVIKFFFHVFWKHLIMP
jgi:hypothetical protein